MFVTELFLQESEGKLIAIFRKGPTLDKPNGLASKIYLWKTGPGQDNFEMEVGQERKRIPVVLSLDQIRQVLAKKGFNESLTPAGKMLVESATSFHRISVTVSDPNAAAVTQRAEKIQKFIKVTGDKENSVKKAISFYKKQGYKVHDASYVGQVGDVGGPLPEANINQQLSLYNPDGKTYRQEKMPSYDENDIFSRLEAVPTDYEEIESDEVRDYDEDSALERITKEQLDKLDPKHAKVLRMRYWDDLTLEQCAAKLNLSLTRIRQIEAKALRMLRRPGSETPFQQFKEASMTKSIPNKQGSVFNRGVEKLVGQQVAIVVNDHPDNVSYGLFKRIGETGLCHIKLNGGKLRNWAAGDMIAVQPNEVFAPWDSRLKDLTSIHREYDDNGEKIVREGKKQEATHRTTVELNDGHDIIPAGSTVRHVEGSSKLYVLLVNGEPLRDRNGIYRIDREHVIPIGEEQVNEIDDLTVANLQAKRLRDLRTQPDEVKGEIAKDKVRGMWDRVKGRESLKRKLQAKQNPAPVITDSAKKK